MVFHSFIYHQKKGIYKIEAKNRFNTKKESCTKAVKIKTI